MHFLVAMKRLLIESACPSVVVDVVFVDVFVDVVVVVVVDVVVVVVVAPSSLGFFHGQRPLRRIGGGDGRFDLFGPSSLGSCSRRAATDDAGWGVDERTLRSDGEKPQILQGFISERQE